MQPIMNLLFLLSIVTGFVVVIFASIGLTIVKDRVEKKKEGKCDGYFIQLDKDKYTLDLQIPLEDVLNSNEIVIKVVPLKEDNFENGV